MGAWPPIPKRFGDLGVEVPKRQALREGRGPKSEARSGGPRGAEHLPKIRRSVTSPLVRRPGPCSVALEELGRSLPSSSH
eukprot:1745649-Alexandrium_andersonii.AAC.1